MRSADDDPPLALRDVFTVTQRPVETLDMSGDRVGDLDAEWRWLNAAGLPC